MKDAINNSDMTTQQKFDDFNSIAEPAVNWLRKNYHPNARIVIEWERAYVLEEEMSKPYLVGLK